MKTLIPLFAALSFSLLATACGKEACTADESAACDSKYSTCMSSCGVGSEPGYAACTQSCGQKLCDCESACGNSCDKDDIK